MSQLFNHIKSNFLFWQPRFDLLSYLLSKKDGQFKIVFLNYLIWFFLLFICYLLITAQPRLFFVIAVAMVIAELIEKFGKRNVIWKRPFFKRHSHTPPGLVESWYKTGSFPSGHTIKATFFFFLVLQFLILNPIIYLIVVVPLILFRVLVGFHYPIDILGGVVIGWMIFRLSELIPSPPVFSQFIQSIFSIMFLN